MLKDLCMLRIRVRYAKYNKNSDRLHHRWNFYKKIKVFKILIIVKEK